MKRSPLALLLVALALFATACGGLGGGDEATPAADGVTPPQPVAADAAAEPTGLAAVLASADEKALAAGSARMALNVSFTSGELPGELKIAAEGIFDLKQQKGDLSLDLSSLTTLMGAQGASLAGFLPDRIVMDGLTMYIHMPGLKQLLPKAKKWVRMDIAELAQQTGQDLGQLSQLGQTNPTQLLALLQAIDGPIEELGAEKIRDANTMHYRVSIDLKKLAGALPAEQQAGLQQQLDATAAQLGLSAIPFDVWVGEDGLLRRMAMTMDLSKAAKADGAKGPLGLSLTIDMFDYGVPVKVKAPPKAKTMDIQELGGLGGALAAAA